MTPSTILPEQNTQEVDFSISLEKANFVGIPIFLLLVLIIVLPYGVIWSWASLWQSTQVFIELKVFLPLLIGGTIVHEFLHAFGWKTLGHKPWSVFKFGVNWKTLTPYAHCTIPLKASAYRKGVALPGIALGVIPAIIGIAVQQGVLTLFGATFFGAASGDFLCLFLMRSVHPHASIQDHPTRAGCLAYIESNEQEKANPV